MYESNSCSRVSFICFNNIEIVVGMGGIRFEFIYSEWLPLQGAIIALPIVLILLVYTMLPP